MRNLRVILASLAVAGVSAVPVSWPSGWPARLQLVAVIPLTLLSVLLIELERRARGNPSAETAAAPASGGFSTPVPAAMAATQVPVPVTVAPSSTLPSQATFRGREAELAAILAQYRGAREGPARSANGRPVLLLVHGKPGVGKSALALELARRLAGEHPDGQYYVNLGNAGDPLSAGESLRVLLDQAGWREQISADGTERSKLFRALTSGRRVLIILDAARDHRQVLDVLPNEPACTVIVTSRRDLGPVLGTTSWLLTEPGPDDSLDILHAIAETHDYLAPVCAAEIVERCGGLPLAVQSAAERVSQEGVEMCDVARMLEPAGSRLEQLTRGGRNFEDGIDTQYRQLNAIERRALLLLTVVPATTFVPWVLAPLLRVPVTQTANLMARLAGMQLLDVAGSDRMTGLARYRMTDLVRLFVSKQLAGDALTAGECTAARRRLLTAYRWVLGEVLVNSTTYPGLTLRTPVEPPAGLRAGSRLAIEVSRKPTQWISSEHSILTECVEDAYRDEEWGLCWRIGVWLGECFPARGQIEPVLRALERAREAAERDGSEVGRLDVLLAQAALLVALERYPEADEVLDQVRGAAGAWRERRPGAAVAAHQREGRAELLAGEAYVQMRRPRQAMDRLERARRIFDELGNDDGSRLVRILEALNLRYDPNEHGHQLRHTGPDRHRFWAMLEQAEAQHRRREWDSAATYLDRALDCCPGDDRRIANVRYRQARLALDRVTAGAGDRASLRYAVRRITETVLAFRHMDNKIGEVRARCLLVRALAAAGQPILAEEHLVAAERTLRRLEDGRTATAVEPLRARLEWARAVLLMAHRRPWETARARQALAEARQIFKDLEDERSKTTIVDLIRRLDGPTAPPGDPAELGDPAEAGDHSERSVRPEAEVVTILTEILDRRLSQGRWDLICEAIDDINRSAQPGQIMILRAAVAELELAESRQVARIGHAPIPAPAPVRERINKLIFKLTGDGLDRGDDDRYPWSQGAGGPGAPDR